MEIRAATIEDWQILLPFYKVIYRGGHPLQNIHFWQWQFGDAQYGQAFIAIDNGTIAGHLGVSIAGGYAWHINLFVMPQYRTSTVLLSLIESASRLGRQGNINANKDAVRLYRLLGWYQYANLIRMTLVSPAFEGKSTDELLVDIPFAETGDKPAGHYWQQPGLQAVVCREGSQAVAQPGVGGLRFVSFGNPKKALEEAWGLGFRWVDYITSFNNPILAKLEKQGWKTDEESNIPWQLNPVVQNSVSNVTFLTREPIPIDFYINRSYSDIGRVGSLPPV